MSAPTGPMNLLTASRVKAWTACPRLHHYRYELGASPVASSAALTFGTAAHAGLEAWWRAIGDDAPADAFHAAAERALISIGDDADAYEAARLVAMLAAYDVRWQRWACSTEVLGVELEFRAPLRHPTTGTVARTWCLAGKIDALVRFADGRVAIVEHKTTSRDATAGGEYRARLTLDAQISTYFDGAAALGHAADLCLYDVLVKPSQKPHEATPVESRKYTKDGKLYAAQREHNESADEYRERLLGVISDNPDRFLVHAEIVRFDDERAAHEHDLWEVVHAIEHARTRTRAGALPARHASACFAHGSPCAFIEVCSGRASIDDPHRYRRLPIHQELSQEPPTDAGEDAA